MPQGVHDSIGADIGIGVNPWFGSFWHVFLIILRSMAPAYSTLILRGMAVCVLNAPPTSSKMSQTDSAEKPPVLKTRKKNRENCQA
jgi:hypothetical protein